MPLKEDFTLHDIHLKKGGDLLDLHNDYHFTGMAYCVADRRVTLGWRKAAGARIPEGLPGELELLYEGVSRFQVLPRDPEMPFTEDDCLACAGWWTDEEWSDGVMICETDGGNGWLRAFQFQSGAIVVIAAGQGKAILRDQPVGTAEGRSG